MRIVIADSCSAFRATLASLLRQEGYEVAGEAADGKALTAVLERIHPDILCLDHELPDTDCHAALTAWGEHEHLRHTSVILMTVSNDDGVRTDAVHDGIAGFLHKPFSQSQVTEELRQVSHARRMLGKLAQHQARQPGTRRPYRVVLADDSVTQRRLLRALLEDAGCEVVAETDNGAAAIELVQEHRPDLTCLDIEMPIMNGLDALSRIHAAQPQLPVMMITSHTERDTVRDAASRGARGYIIKPYQPDKVRAAIDALRRLAAA